MNTRKVGEILATVFGGLSWGLLPVTGITTNYAVTATDEAILLGSFVVGQGIADVVNNVYAKNFMSGFGQGALGLLAWDLGQQMFTSKQVRR